MDASLPDPEAKIISLFAFLETRLLMIQIELLLSCLPGEFKHEVQAKLRMRDIRIDATDILFDFLLEEARHSIGLHVLHLTS